NDGERRSRNTERSPLPHNSQPGSSSGTTRNEPTINNVNFAVAEVNSTLKAVMDHLQHIDAKLDNVNHRLANIEEALHIFPDASRMYTPIGPDVIAPNDDNIDDWGHPGNVPQIPFIPSGRSSLYPNMQDTLMI